jgi:hypothetical protein
MLSPETFGGYVMNSKDFYPHAKILIEQYGSEVCLHVLQRLLEMRQAGDEGGEMMWRTVYKAVLELKNMKPPPGEFTH